MKVCKGVLKYSKEECCLAKDEVDAKRHYFGPLEKLQDGYFLCPHYLPHEYHEDECTCHRNFRGKYYRVVGWCIEEFHYLAIKAIREEYARTRKSK